MKKIIAFIVAFSVILGMTSNSLLKEPVNTEAATNILAFPGAVGGGKYATGGRGGQVVHVTNLNDSGTGSFRDAVSQSNRIVVFDVSGTIELKSNIIVSSNVTIAGQTAPGGSGITLKNYKLGMGGDNIICRFISSRPGPYKATSSGNDAWGGAKGSNSIIDHCSMGWTTDEQWALYSNNEYYTVQYSVIGPADSWGGHSKGLHGFGIMMGKGYCTFDHNLIVHNVSRNFRGKVQGTATADFTNNVIYNWAYQTAYGTIGHLNYVNNTLKMGNGTTGGKQYVYVDSGTKPENFSIYCTGNRMLNKDGSVYSSVTDDNWNGINVKASLTEAYGITKASLKSTSAFKTMVNGKNVSTATTCESAEDSYEHVLEYAGNGISSDTRTAIDQQCALEARNGTGNMSGTAAYSDGSSSEKENLDKYNIQCGVTYTYPSANYNKIADTDNDGMEDTWELERGLNPYDASDVNGDYCGKGYTNIEYYINDLTVDAFPEGVVEVSPTTTEVELPELNLGEALSMDLVSDNNAASVNGTTYTFNGTGNKGLQIENPFVGKDVSNGAIITFWVKPSQSITPTDGAVWSCIPFLSIAENGATTTDGAWITYYGGGQKQFVSRFSSYKYQINAGGANSMSASKEYFVTCVFRTSNGDFDYYVNGIKWEPSGEYYSNKDQAFTKCADFIKAFTNENVTIYAGGYGDVPAGDCSNWGQVASGTVFRDFKGYLGEITDAQAKTLYQDVLNGDDNGSSSTPKPTSTPTETPTATPVVPDTLSGKLFKRVKVVDETYRAFYSIDASLEVGDKVFGDRDFTFTAIDEFLVEAEYLVTACDSKKTESNLATIITSEDAIISVGFDERLTTTPSWTSGYTKTDMTCVASNDVIFEIYQKEVKAGDTVVLGSQGQSSGVVGYIAMVTVKSETDVEPTATPVVTATPVPTETHTPVPVVTETPTVTPTETESPVKVTLGDVDDDGDVDANDALLVLKHAAKLSLLNENGFKAGDVNTDGNLDATDALLILKYAARLIDEF